MVKHIENNITFKLLNYECTPQEMFDWYLQKSKKTLLNSIEKNNGKPVILCVTVQEDG